MKKKLTNIALILVSAFAFTSCGDSKEAVVDDMIELMEESSKAIASGNKDAIAKIAEKNKKLQERAKAVDLTPSTMPDDLKKKLEAAKTKMMGEKIGNIQAQYQKAINKQVDEIREKEALKK